MDANARVAPVCAPLGVLGVWGLERKADMRGIGWRQRATRQRQRADRRRALDAFIRDLASGCIARYVA